MKNNKRKTNGLSPVFCLSIVVLAMNSFLPAFGNSSAKKNSDTGDHKVVVTENFRATSFGLQNYVTKTVTPHTLSFSKHGHWHFARSFSPHLRHRPHFNAIKNSKAANVKRHSRKFHGVKKLHLRKKGNPSRNKLFAMLGNAVQMEALHYRINALLPAVDGWKQDVDSIIQTYLSGMEPYDSILVVGYTDNTGSKKGNLQLSRQRAANIAAYLAKQGIPENLIHIAAVGEDCPVTTNKTIQGRNSNRRVEINFLKSS